MVQKPPKVPDISKFSSQLYPIILILLDKIKKRDRSANQGQKFESYEYFYRHRGYSLSRPVLAISKPPHTQHASSLGTLSRPTVAPLIRSTPTSRDRGADQTIQTHTHESLGKTESRWERWRPRCQDRRRTKSDSYDCYYYRCYCCEKTEMKVFERMGNESNR